MSRRRILILFLVFLLVLSVSGYVVLHTTGAARSFVQNLISQTIRSDLFKLDDAEIDLTSGRVTVRKFELKNPELGEKNANLLSIDKIEVEVETNPLGQVGAVRRVKLDGLEFNLSLAEGETPDLADILRVAAVEPDTKVTAIPSISAVRSTLHLRVAQDRPTVTFTDLQLTLMPVASNGDQLELRGTMISPLGHKISLRGGGNYKTKQFRALLTAHDIPIMPEQAAAFRAEAAEFLDSAKVTGVIKKTTLWMESSNPDGAVGTEGHGLKAGLSAELEDLSAAPAQFPYPIHGASGRLHASLADNGTIKFHLDNKAVDGDISATGVFTECFSNSRLPLMEVQVEAKDVLIGDRLTAAFAGSKLDAIEKVQSAFAPTAGRVDADIRVFNSAEALGPRASAEITLKGVAARFHGFAAESGKRMGFPYPVQGVRGLISVRPGKIVLQDIAGTDAKAGKFTIDGFVDVADTGASPNIDIRATEIEFSDAIRASLAALVDGGDAIYDEYAPQGKCDVFVKLRDQGRGTDYSVELSPALASAAYASFPYRIGELRGSVKIANDGVSIDLDGKRNKTVVSIDGRFLFGPDPAVEGLRSELWIKGTALPFDPDVYAAAGTFSKEITKAWDFAQPRGELDFEFALWKEREDDEYTYDVHAHVQDGSAEFRDFPVPMEKLTGDLFLHGKGTDCRCDISPLRADILNSTDDTSAKVLVQGTIHTTDKGIATDITSIVRRVRLTPELGKALHKVKLLDQSTWDTLKLDGLLDLTAHQSKTVDQSLGNNRLLIRMQDVQSTSDLLPGRTHDVHGQIVVEDGIARFDQIEGMIDKSKVILRAGTMRRDGNKTIVAFTAGADSFPIDEHLARVMSGPVRKAYLESKIKGRAKLSEFRVDIVVPDTGDDVEVRFAGDVKANDLFLDVGLPGGHSVEHLTGTASVSGSVDARGGQLTGNLQDVGFELSNQRIYGITSRFEITPQELTLHELKFTVAGGLVEGNGDNKLSLRYSFAPPGRLSAHLAYRDVSLNALLKERGLAHSKVRGLLAGNVVIDELVGSNFLDMNARGTVVVSNGRLGRVPVFSALYSHIAEDKRPQFNQADVEFVVKDQKIRLAKIKARSQEIKIEGSGTLGMDGYMDVRLKLPGLFGSAADILILPPLIDWTVSKVVNFQLYGYIRDPKLSWTFNKQRGRTPLAPIGPPPSNGADAAGSNGATVPARSSTSR